MNADVEAHLRALVSFPSPPGVATHIIEIAGDPNIEMSKVAKALSLDSALASKVLRIANSPLYAQRRKSENLRQALVVLGLNATLTLALSFSLVKSLRAGKANGLSHPLYWRRALLAATSARALADALHHPLSEEIFLAALLQDIGMLALDQAVPDLYPGEAAQRDHLGLCVIERQRLNADHAQIGGWLMGTWNMPERLRQAISRSHLVESVAAKAADQVFDRCVALSGPVADLFLQDAQERQFVAVAQDLERNLGLDKLAFGQVLGTIGAMIPETEAIFESESLPKQHPEVILEQAREVLMLRSLHALRELNALRTVASPAHASGLEEEIRSDPLTGLYNRAHLELVLKREFGDVMLHKGPLSVAVAELDDFTSIADRIGPEAGDRILQVIARTLVGNTRGTDLICRQATGQFVIILPATNAATARVVCERIVAACKGTRHRVGSEEIEMTVSIGCATHGERDRFDDPETLIDAADQALFTAKLRGHDRFEPHAA